MTEIKVFVDSDVVISSFISKKGAAYLLINGEIPIKHFVSNLSVNELGYVSKRPDFQIVNVLEVEKRFDVVDIGNSAQRTNKEFEQYVLDLNDAHIVAGAHKAGCNFLTTYNLKDYKIQIVKNELGINVVTPGTLLQYLRGLELV